MNKEGIIKADHVLDKSVSQAFRELLELLNQNIDAVRKIKSIKGAEQTVRKLAEADSKLNAVLVERQRQLKALNRQEAKNAEVLSDTNKQLLEQRFQTQELNKRNRQGAILVSKYADAYKKLSVRTSIAKREYQNLLISLGATAPATKKARREFERLNKRLDKARKAAKDFRGEVGNYPSAFRRVVPLVKEMSAAFGIYSALEIGREFYGQVLELDRLDKALKKVTEGQGQYNEAVEFITKTSNAYGIEIKNLTDSYTSFLGGLKGTALEGEKGAIIFDKVNRVSAALGKTTEENQGIMNAFVQIISKGKVQAEELRGQLGDRLPGAFNIMARALDVPVSQLDKMLENGELMAEDVLPKFADELAKTFGVETTSSIDNMASAQNRLSNEWTRFVANLSGDQGILKNVFLGTLSFLQSVLGSINDISESIRKAFESESTKAAREEYDRFNAVLKKQEASLNSIVQARLRYTAALKESFELQENLEQRLLRDSGFNDSTAKGVSDALVRLAQETDTYSEFVERSQNIIQREDLLSRDYLATLFTRLKGIQNITDATARQIEKENQLQAIIKKSGDSKNASLPFTQKVELDKSYEAALKYFEVFKENAKLDIEVNDLDKEFLDTKGVEAGLTVLADKLGVTYEDLYQEFDSLYQVDYESYIKFQDKKLEEAGKGAEIMKTLFEGVFSSFSSYYGVDLGLFENLFAGKKATVDDYADFAKSGAAAITNSIVNGYDEELSKTISVNQAILDNDKSTEQQKEVARKKIENARKRERIKRFEAEKQATLVQIAIDAAAGIVKAAFKPGFPEAYGLIPFIFGLGATQAAFVASQKIPQYFKGKPISDNYEGWATVGERGREVIIDKDGNIEVTPAKTTLRHVKKDDVIIPSIKEYNEMLNPRQFNHVAAISTRAKQASQDTPVLQNKTIRYTGPTADEIAKAIKKHLKDYLNRPIENHVTVEVPRPNRR